MKLKQLFAAALCVLVFASCSVSGCENNTETVREISQTTTLEMVLTTAAAVENIFDADTEYMNGANAAFSGFAAFDDDFIYYVNNADKNNLYKKAYDETDIGTVIAHSNEYGFLNSVCVWGDRVYFISRYDTENDTEGTEGDSFSKCYSVDKNGGDLRTEFENAGSLSVTDSKIVYTGDPMRADYSLNIFDIASGTSEKIADYAEKMSAADNKILYIEDGESPTIMLYDIKTRENKEIAPFNIVGEYGIMLSENYVITYSFAYDNNLGAIISELRQINIDTGEEKLIDSGYSVSPAEFASEAVCNGFTLYGGKLYYCKYTWRSSTKAIRSLYSYDFENPPVLVTKEDVLLEEYVSNQPYVSIFATPRGIFSRDDNGMIFNLQ